MSLSHNCPSYFRQGLAVDGYQYDRRLPCRVHKLRSKSYHIQTSHVRLTSLKASEKIFLLFWISIRSFDLPWFVTEWQRLSLRSRIGSVVLFFETSVSCFSCTTRVCHWMLYKTVNFPEDQMISTQIRSDHREEWWDAPWTRYVFCLEGWWPCCKSLLVEQIIGVPVDFLLC